MNRLDQYRHILRSVIQDYASCRPCHGNIESEAIVDDTLGHYEVVRVGWDGDRRVHGSVIHIDIRGDKIWVQYDGTNRPVAEELLAAGIPREDIVLAFHPAEVRPLTGYAVG